MRCQEVIKLLSPFFDEVLETDIAVGVSAHLRQCPGCMRELERLNSIRRQLKSLGRTEAPDYLHHLLQLRLSNAEQDTWRARLRDALEYRWSRIRTTEGIWFLTRILGTAMTFFFFFTLSSAMNPILLDIRSQAPEKGSMSQTLRQQLVFNILKNLGLIPLEAQKKPISPSDPMINDLYLLNFGESAMRSGDDDTFSVVTMVDRSGAAKIQNVLEYPADRTLLTDFNSMLISARCRPAIQNGRAVDARMVMSFSKIYVYD
jgi:putative zinc finger protein